MSSIVAMSAKENNPKLTKMPGYPKITGRVQNRMVPISIISLSLITIVGGFIRIIHVINLDFPLNDGGFFYQMIIDLQDAFFTLPDFTTYNRNNIPYAYPPLGFYIGASLSSVFNYSVFDVIRILPGVISILTIPAIYHLFKRFLEDESEVIAATFVFTFLPTSFDWLIVGGGLTRSLGYLFAILTIGEVFDLFTTDNKRKILSSLLFASLTILSHPGTAWFVFYCTAIILGFNFKRSNQWLFKSILVSLGILLLTSPWWFTIISRHGFSVLVSPLRTETISLSSLLTPLSFLFTNEPLLGLLAFCGLLGVVISLKNRSFFLPFWLFSTFIFEPRLGATYSVIPMAMLAGIGIIQGLKQIIFPSPVERTGGFQRRLSQIVISYFIIYVIISAYLGINYRTVTIEQISAMNWIKKNTPESAQFLVLSGTPEYGIDQISEWFPALSQRSSLTTPQGHEWLPNNEFSQRIQQHTELQDLFVECTTHEISFIDSWAELHLPGYTHIYIPDSISYQPSVDFYHGYDVLYNGAGGMIIERNLKQ
jgi:hypothetical protein